jgi:hypothetical protein
MLELSINCKVSGSKIEMRGGRNISRLLIPKVSSALLLEACSFSAPLVMPDSVTKLTMIDCNNLNADEVARFPGVKDLGLTRCTGLSAFHIPGSVEKYYGESLDHRELHCNADLTCLTVIDCVALSDIIFSSNLERLKLVGLKALRRVVAPKPLKWLWIENCEQLQEIVLKSDEPDLRVTINSCPGLLSVETGSGLRFERSATSTVAV